MSGVNLKAIAERAEVSLATASRVLSGSSYPVTDELRERVLKVAEELHYVPNAAAQGLLSGRTQTVGVLVGDVADPFFSAMIGGIHEAADELGYVVTIVNTYRHPEAELRSFRRLHAHRVDIMIIAGSGLSDSAYQVGLAGNVMAFVRSGGAVVAIGRHDLPRDAPVSHVAVDNRGGAQLVAEHLRALGHRHIALLTGELALHSTTDRVAGFRDVHGEHGVKVIPVAPTRDGGHAAALEILAGETEVTAIAATADQMAFGALVALRERGVAVPERMSVSGFNDIEISRDLVPSLTSVHVPLREAGRRALEIGHAALAPGGQAQEVSLGLTLAVRESTGPAQGA